MVAPALIMQRGGRVRPKIPSLGNHTLPRAGFFFEGNMPDHTDLSKLDYPKGAAQVRDLIREMIKSQTDQGSSMDTGGGMGSADLWASFDGTEYYISVKPVG